MRPSKAPQVEHICRIEGHWCGVIVFRRIGRLLNPSRRYYITKFLGQTQIREEVLDFMGLGSCMPREAWRLPSPQTLHLVWLKITSWVLMTLL